MPKQIRVFDVFCTTFLFLILTTPIFPQTSPAVTAPAAAANAPVAVTASPADVSVNAAAQGATVPPLAVSDPATQAPGTATPPQTPSPANEAVVSPKPEQSFLRLSHPAVADRMGLSDEQRSKVSALINELQQQLIKSPKEQWDGIRAETEKKLAGVLTDAQRANWQKILNEKTIRLNFKFQKWEDVLVWFADQVGMQLVMDAPPTGTFNFTDPTDYTPIQALDKINGTLLGYGYTLVRRDKMLHLFNLKRIKIPMQYLMKLKPDELAGYGDFEFVAVTFSLGRRDRNAVQEAIKLYLGPFQQTIPQEGNGLTIIETAGTLRVVQKVIDSIPEPDPPKKEEQKKPDPPPPQEWQTYIMEKADPAKVEEVVKQFCGVNQTVRMPNSMQLHILATKDQHQQIRQIIDRLEIDPGTVNQPVVDVYSLDQLADAPPERLWAMYRGPMTRGIMRGMMGQREPGQSRDFSQNANFFDINTTFFDELLKIIKEITPNAMLSYERNNRKLVVLAVPADQEKISTLLEKLKRTPTSSEAILVKLYKLKSELVPFNSDLTDSIRRLAPQAQITYNERNKSLLVIGTADEHKLISDTMKELESVPTDNLQRKVVSYPVNVIQQQRFAMLSRELFGQPEFDNVLELSEGRNNQLTIWATPEQHAQIRQILNELVGMGESAGTGETVGMGDQTAGNGNNVPGNKEGNKLKVETFTLRRVNASSAQFLLTQVVPGISLVVEPGTNSLIVYGTEQTLAAVRDFVEKIDAEFGLDIRVIPLNEKLPDEVMPTLQAMFRHFGSVVFDEKNMRLIAYGPKGDLDQVEKIVESVTKSDGTEPRSIRVQPVERAMPDQIVNFVRECVPRARIEYDKENKRFTIAGTATEQLLASKLILESEASLPPKEQIRFFNVGQAVSEKMISLIKNQVSYIVEIKRDDQDPMVLYVKAQPAVLDEVEQLLEQIKTELPSTGQHMLQSYPVTQTERSRFDLLQEDLKKEIGDFRLMNDDRKNMLVVWALPQQQERIGKLLETIRAEVPAELQEEVIIHSLRVTGSDTVQTMIKEIYPDIKITDDKPNGRLILRVPKQNADALKTLLDQIDSRDPNRTKRYFASYPVGNVYTYDAVGNYRGPVSLLQELQQLVPNAKVSYDYFGATVVVWGTDDEQAIVRETIEKVYHTDPANKFGRFPIRRAEPGTLINIVQRMFPASPVSYDQPGKTLIVQGINSAQLELI
ncbi:MAG: hypothetical protein FWC50_03980, partial [Planctomycetaceae bacterium]|nr:hypothetical protein [Planctomycetaceae bacterium]